MCHEATVNGKAYDLAGDLAAVLPAGLVPDPRYVEAQGAAHSIAMDGCLCQVDLRATAERNGYEARHDDDSPCDVWFERPGVIQDGDQP